MWNLSETKGEERIYQNSVTGSKCITKKVYTDKEGNRWHQFSDLMTLPFTRNFAATKISSLYSLGLSKDDLTGHIAALKSLLKSEDKEKYEKAYAEVLDFEAKALNATDAIKQITSLVCVYFLLNDEPIDSFENSLQLKKMTLIESDIEMHSFFLQRQTEATELYTKRLSMLSEIVSMPLSEMPQVSQ